MSSCDRFVRAVAAAALCLSLSACGPRPTDANQRRIVTLLQQQVGAVKSFHFLPVESRCRLEFECYIIPYQGTPGLYRGSSSFDGIDYEPFTPAPEPAAK